MRVAYLFPGHSSFGRVNNGIIVQAMTWANELRRMGVDVVLYNAWEGCDFNQCDIVHLFSYYAQQEIFIRTLKNVYNVQVAISPIIDTNRSAWQSTIASRIHFPRLHLYSVFGSLRASVPYVDAWFVRSEYEGAHLRRALGVDAKRIHKVMLPVRIAPVEEIGEREPFCLLTCFLPAPRKNVMRLIEAAIKFGFRLVLVGEKTSQSAYDEMMRKIDGHQNIEVKGRVSDEELLELYRRARVFALPSLMEGVGLVALEAAANGCDIVLTNRGGPKEYYNGMASLVDPLSVDQIGHAVMEFLEGKTFQPQLRDHIVSNYSLDKTVQGLKSAYSSMLADR